MRDVMIKRIYENRNTIGRDFVSKDYYSVPVCMTNIKTIRRYIKDLEQRYNEKGLFPYDGYEKMSDEELISVFERIIRRAYSQR